MAAVIILVVAVTAYLNACPRTIDLMPGGFDTPSKGEVFWAEHFCPLSKIVY